jgi:CheY-like chemotaxis protein/anti-sigma regulatory factor (Ser/Thr protein kinase)
VNKTYRILIVDDDNDMLVLLKSILVAKGYDIATCSGVSAIARAVDFIPHLIVLDIEMPVVSGHVVLEELRTYQHFKQTPVIVLTAHADIDTVHKAIKKGASAYIIKGTSFGTSLLVRKIHELLQVDENFISYSEGGNTMTTVSILSDPTVIGTFMRNQLLPVLAELPGWQQPEAEIAVIEMLENARIHGNHEITTKEITVSWELSAETLVMTVRDEGTGFNKEIPDECPPVTATSGRGLWTLKDMGYNPTFNEIGNEISITIPRRGDYGRMTKVP